MGFGEDGPPMSYVQTLEALAALEGDQVTLVIHPPEWDASLRPVRGTLTRKQFSAGDDRAVFAVEHPRDDRWANPTGTAFSVRREGFVSAQRCGGPGQLGVSFLQGGLRMTVYPGL
jgi:hypothetical protein